MSGGYKPGENASCGQLEERMDALIGTVCYGCNRLLLHGELPVLLLYVFFLSVMQGSDQDVLLDCLFVCLFLRVLWVSSR